MRKIHAPNFLLLISSLLAGYSTSSGSPIPSITLAGRPFSQATTFAQPTDTPAWDPEADITSSLQVLL